MSNLGFEVRLLQEEDLREGSGFFETLANLRSEPLPDFAQMRGIFHERLKRGVVTDVVVLEGMIVATTSTVFEPKFIHNGGWIAHVEDVATRKGYERKGYASALLDRLLGRARTFKHPNNPDRVGCYKVILDCSLPNVLFYARKHGFHPHEISMRLDL
jgi:glucosamine-phosphate N-acetyltransferase